MRTDELITLIEGFESNGIEEITSFKYNKKSNTLSMIYSDGDSKDLKYINLKDKEWQCSGEYKEGIWACDNCAYKEECILENSID